MARAVDRVLLVVCDSFGVGEGPDAADYGDTRREHARSRGASRRRHQGAEPGGHGPGQPHRDPRRAGRAGGPGTAQGKLTERSAGKDTTTGHWEICGIVLDRPFPTYPGGFPPEVIEPFEARHRPEGPGEPAGVGHRDHRRVGGGAPEDGPSHRLHQRRLRLSGGHPRADRPSGAALRVVPRRLGRSWTADHRVGRVIARPFDGEPGAFVAAPGAPRLLGAAARATRCSTCLLAPASGS